MHFSLSANLPPTTSFSKFIIVAGFPYILDITNIYTDPENDGIYISGIAGALGYMENTGDTTILFSPTDDNVGDPNTI